MVEYDFETGHFTRKIAKLERRLSSTLIFNKVKIGITNDPETRFSAHRRAENWRKMRVIYQSSSIDYVSSAEAYLIERFRHKLLNRGPGGNGNIGKYGPYFLYVLYR